MGSEKKPKGAGKSSFDLIDTNVLTAGLGIKPGSVMLDIGCGQGNYTRFLSDLTGTGGQVVGIDLWPGGIQSLENRVKTGGYANIRALLADATAHIELPDDHFDFCLMATVLHDFAEFNNEAAVLGQARRLLKEGGALAVIEFKKIPGPPGPPVQIRLSETEVDAMVAAFGFKKVKGVDIGEYHYLTVFRLQKKDSAG